MTWWPPSLLREIRDLESQVDELATDRDEAVADRDRLAELLENAEKSKGDLRRDAQAARQAMREAFEPAQTPLCRKLRYLYREDAEGHAIHLLSRTGGPDVLNAYECDRCPVHPGYGSRWWHVGHCYRTDDGAITVSGAVANYRCGCVWGVRAGAWLMRCAQHAEAIEEAS